MKCLGTRRARAHACLWRLVGLRVVLLLGYASVVRLRVALLLGHALGFLLVCWAGMRCDFIIFNNAIIA